MHPRIESSVVLPEPEGPMSSVSSPGRRSRLTPLRMCRSPAPVLMVLVMLRATMIGSRGVAVSVVIDRFSLGLKSDPMPHHDRDRHPALFHEAQAKQGFFLIANEVARRGSVLPKHGSFIAESAPLKEEAEDRVTCPPLRAL